MVFKKAKAERNLDIDVDTPVVEALERLEFTRNGRLTNAAVLLFGENPQKFFLMAETRCGRFKGTEPVKPFIDMKVFSGSIIDQVDNAEDFVLRNISMAAWVEQGKTERTEKWEYPLDAIREAIINAICHRDYQISSNVQVRIFDDRIEIWGCGSLPAPLTVEALKRKHVSILRNRLIGKCFFLIKFIEQWGTGTNDMISMCLEYGLPEPIFEEISGSLVVTIRKDKYTEELLVKLDLNERQLEAMKYLKNNKEITRQEYASLNKCAIRTAFNDLQEMVGKQILQRKGSGKYTYYELI